jgi:predicted PurR-regulated permease PerM
MLYDSISSLISLLPSFFDSTFEYLSGLSFLNSLDLEGAVDRLLETRPWETWANDKLKNIQNIDIGAPLQFLSSLLSNLIVLILAVVSSIYFLLEYNSIKAYLKRVIQSIPSVEKRKNTLKYVRLTDTSFRKFLTCQILDSFILGTITTIEFLIMGSKYAFILGIMLGIVNIIPYFGSIIGSFVAVLIIMFTQGFDVALIASVVLLITQQFDGNFINPRIMGTSFKISPVLVIIAITVGGVIGNAVGGGIGRIAGMVFSIPVVNVFKIILEEYLQIREAAEAGIIISEEDV